LGKCVIEIALGNAASSGVSIWQSVVDSVSFGAEALMGVAPAAQGAVLFSQGGPGGGWHKGTFGSVSDSIKYHLKKHGKDRTLEQYTEAAKKFFNENKHLGEKVELKDGTMGIKIKTKKIIDGKVVRIGGYWTSDGKMVTFWD
jgi:hypothetical protein